MSKARDIPVDASDLDDLDKAILDYLQEGRDNPDEPWGIATPSLVHDVLKDQGHDVVRQTINNRMKRLELAGHLENVREKGVYKFESDPRDT